MRDIDLYTLMRAKLVNFVPLRWSEPLGYLMRFQFQQEGRPSEPTLWFCKVIDRRRGQRKSTTAWTGTRMQRVESQLMETTLQISATRDAASDDNMTASDAMNVIAGVMQSDDWISSLRPHGVQVLRVTDVNLQHDKNDSDQWEESPRFDITFSHNDTWIDGQQHVSNFTFDIWRI